MACYAQVPEVALTPDASKSRSSEKRRKKRKARTPILSADLANAALMNTLPRASHMTSDSTQDEDEEDGDMAPEVKGVALQQQTQAHFAEVASEAAAAPDADTDDDLHDAVRPVKPHVGSYTFIRHSAAINAGLLARAGRSCRSSCALASQTDPGMMPHSKAQGKLDAAN